MNEKRLLIIEDDVRLAKGIALALMSEEMIIEQCHNLQEARACIEEKEYHLLILDINLPDGNGLELLREVKREYGASVIILTANDLETDIVTGLESGADDYVTKPFSLAVLRARVNAQLRKIPTEKRLWGERTQGSRMQDTEDMLHDGVQIFRQGELQFDFERMEFYKNGIRIELSKTEQKLLRILTMNKGITLERSRLMDYVWSEGWDYVDENALSVAVKRLRDKLEEHPSKPQHIKTVYGIGYVWEAE